MRLPEYKVEKAEVKKAVLYLRVSTEEQVTNYSLGTQEAICRREASQRGYEVDEVFKEEGKSAKNMQRPVLTQMIAYCKRTRKIEAVIIYRIDRISRSTYDFLTIKQLLKKSNVKLISTCEPTGDSPMDNFVEVIMATSAELENNIKSERTRNGMYARFLSGLVSCTPPLGYIKSNGFVIKDPESFDIVREAWNIMATGTKSLNEIAAIMNDFGLQTHYANVRRKIRSQTADRIFRNKFYAGYLVSKTYNEEVHGQHVPMITEEQYYKVQAIIDGRSTQKITLKRNRNNPDFPLRRLIACCHCKYSLTAGWSQGRCKRYAYYFCSSKCTGKSIPVNDIHNALLALLKDTEWTPQARALLTNLIYAKYKNRLALLEKKIRGANQTIIQLKEQQRLLVEKNLSGLYSDDIFREQNRKIETLLKEAELIQEEGIIEQYAFEKIKPHISRYIDTLDTLYAKLELSQQRVLFSLIFATRPSWGYPRLINIDLSPFIYNPYYLT